MNRPLIGVAVILIKDGLVLLGKRKNAHGKGTWALPGGHLELNETIEACAKREVFEETGLSIKHIHQLTYTNDIFIEEQKHYVTLFVTADYDHVRLELKEPHKCEQWAWFPWDDLPKPRFLPLENLLKQNVLEAIFEPKARDKGINAMDELDELTDLKNRLQKIEQDIIEAKRRIPPHSTKPAVMQMLLALEDERDELLDRIARLKR